jgi:uncharacterized protein YeaO (DUF488 family)
MKVTVSGAGQREVSGMTARVGRIYDPASRTDGVRVLVDRLWPRGLSRAKAGLDEWCKQIAPSTELRKWYSHDPRRFAEFRRRYLRELDGPEQSAALAHLKELAGGGTLTLLTASKDVAISEATVLAKLIDEEPRSVPNGFRQSSGSGAVAAARASNRDRC